MGAYVSFKQEDMTRHGKNTSGLVYSAHAKITDIEARAEEMIKTISDTSWINRLGAVEKRTFEARSNRTISKLVNLIVSRVEDEISAEFGKFMISDSAQRFLESNFRHTKLPLAELLKEKITGNPGFDFHTESSSNLIAFGEAKYSGSSTPHSRAIKQIVEFITLEKDSAELIIIKNFVSAGAVQKAINGDKAYVAAFSINGMDPESIINNALKSTAIDPLLAFPELYMIGIEVDA